MWIAKVTWDYRAKGGYGFLLSPYQFVTGKTVVNVWHVETLGM